MIETVGQPIEDVLSTVLELLNHKIRAAVLSSYFLRSAMAACSSGRFFSTVHIMISRAHRA